MLCVVGLVVAFGFFVAKISTLNHTQRRDITQGKQLVSLAWMLG
jgi:hypothetical protein